jgi:methylenetetrahydrofolate--tRNA-(uracil-5-)-methyltransferase
MHYICNAEAKNFQPANVTFDLLPPLDEASRRRIRDKRERHRIQCERALERFDHWWKNLQLQPSAHESEAPACP